MARRGAIEMPVMNNRGTLNFNLCFCISREAYEAKYPYYHDYSKKHQFNDELAYIEDPMLNEEKEELESNSNPAKKQKLTPAQWNVTKNELSSIFSLFHSNKLLNFVEMMKFLSVSSLWRQALIDIDNFWKDISCFQYTYLLSNTIVEQIAKYGASRVERLNLCGNVLVPTSCLKKVAQNCKNLQAIDLSFNPFVTDEILMELAANCPNLQAVSLAYCSELTVEGIQKFIQSCSKLACLELFEQMCSDVLTSLAEKKSTLRHLVLTSVIPGQCSDESIAKMAECPNLELADFSSCFDITPQTLLLFKNVPVVLTNLETGQQRNSGRHFMEMESNSFADFGFSVCDEEDSSTIEIGPGGYADDCSSFCKFSWIFGLGYAAEGFYEGNITELRPVFLKLGMSEHKEE